MRDRINGSEQLRALYKGNQKIEGRQPLTEADTWAREPNPLAPVDPAKIEIIDMITEADRQMHELGLKKMGLSDNLIARIRMLDDIAPNTGKFLSIALEKLSRSYYVQVMELMELANATRKRLMAQKTEPDYIANDEARAFFNRNYVDMVKESGRAYELFLNGTQALLEMMLRVQGDDDKKPGGRSKKHGWDIPSAPKVKTPMPD